MRRGEHYTSRQIVLQGEYDLADKEALALLFRSLPADGPVTIDMTGVTYIDSTVLNELSLLHSRFGEYPVKLSGVNENLQRLFQVVNFDRLFEIAE